MKEATGELNMTVITVVAIAAVAAFFYAFVWPNIKATINRNTYCSQAWGCSCNGNTCSCLYCPGGDDTTCTSPSSVTCPNQNNTSSS